MQLSGPVWLAELGRPQSVWIYSMRNNSVDVRESVAGVGASPEMVVHREGACTV